MALNHRQLLFVKEYLVDLNATQAAIRAGYSVKTAAQIGDENLRKPQIAQVIQESMSKRAEKVDISAQTVLESIIRIGKAAEAKEDYSNALKGQELLGKHLKLFTDKTELTGANGVPLIPAPVYKVVKS